MTRSVPPVLPRPFLLVHLSPEAAVGPSVRQSLQALKELSRASGARARFKQRQKASLSTLHLPNAVSWCKALGFSCPAAFIVSRVRPREQRPVMGRRPGSTEQLLGRGCPGSLSISSCFKIVLSAPVPFGKGGPCIFKVQTAPLVVLCPSFGCH